MDINQTITGNTVKGSNNTISINNYFTSIEEVELLREQVKLLKIILEQQAEQINLLKSNQNENNCRR